MNGVSYYRNLVILAGLGPFLMLAWDGWNDQLGANGVNNALHISGILSLVFLFCSLLITPLRVITGWNSLIAYRRALGLYGFAYAALHFGIYVMWDRMGSLSSTVEEIVSRRFLTVGFVALALMLPLAVTSTNAMIRKMGPSRWKMLHRFAYVAAILGVVHYYMLVKSDVREPLAFAAVLAPILGFRSVKHYWDLRQKASKPPLRSTEPSKQTRAFWNGELVIKNIHRETHDVKTFRFVHPDGDIPFVHRPGQYMTLSLTIHGQSVKRSYTIASAPSQRGHVELTIKRHPEGLVSRYMHDQVKEGDRIRIAAPGGKFFFDDLQSESVVLIAGGVGITPVMSMLRNLTDRSWDGSIYFINAMRTDQDRIYRDELAGLAQRFDNLHVLSYLSQSTSGPDAITPSSRWKERTGYIQAEDLRAFVPNLKECPVFLCGPGPMMDAVRRTLVALGIPDEQISTEEFISPVSKPTSDESSTTDPSNSNDGEVQPATIHFQVSGQSIDIDESTTILEAAEQVGVTLSWECRAGICGQCKVRCTTGRVKLDSRDALTQAEEASGYILACQSRAITDSVSIEA